MAKKKSNTQLLLIVGGIALAGYAAYKLLPVMAAKLRGSSTSGTGAGVGSGVSSYPGTYADSYPPYQQDTSLMTLLNSLIKGLTGGSKASGASSADKGGAGAPGAPRGASNSKELSGLAATNTDILNSIKEGFNPETGQISSLQDNINTGDAQAPDYLGGQSISYLPTDNQSSLFNSFSQPVGYSVPEQSGIVASNGDQPGASNYTGPTADTFATYGNGSGSDSLPGAGDGSGDYQDMLNPFGSGGGDGGGLDSSGWGSGGGDNFGDTGGDSGGGDNFGDTGGDSGGDWNVG